MEFPDTRLEERESLGKPVNVGDPWFSLNLLANVALNSAHAQVVWRHDLELRILERRFMSLQEQIFKTQVALRP